MSFLQRFINYIFLLLFLFLFFYFRVQLIFWRFGRFTTWLSRIRRNSWRLSRKIWQVTILVDTRYRQAMVEFVDERSEMNLWRFSDENDAAFRRDIVWRDAVRRIVMWRDPLRRFICRCYFTFVFWLVWQFYRLIQTRESLNIWPPWSRKLIIANNSSKWNTGLMNIKAQLLILLQNVCGVNRERSHLAAASSVCDSTKPNALVTLP